MADQIFDTAADEIAVASDIRNFAYTRRVDVLFLKYGHSGTYYQVKYGDETLVQNTKDPGMRRLPCLGRAGLYGALGNVGRRELPAHGRSRHRAGSKNDNCREWQRWSSVRAI